MILIETLSKACSDIYLRGTHGNYSDVVPYVQRGREGGNPAIAVRSLQSHDLLQQYSNNRYCTL